MGKPATVDEYLDGFTGAGRELLAELRALAHKAVPRGYPAWLHPSGTILFMISGHAKHAGVAFTPSTREAFDVELTGYDTGKGTVKLPYGEPVPTDLLRRMIAFRVRAHEDDGVLWM